MKAHATFTIVVAAALLACGGSDGPHKTTFPIKDEATKKPTPKKPAPVARSLKDLVGGQLVSVNVVGAGPHTETVRKAIGSKPGDAFNADRISSDIRAVWATTKIEDVKVNGVLTAAGKVALTFTIKPRATVRSLVFEGNKGLSNEALTALSKLEKGSLLNMVKVFNLRDKIGDAYTEQGYLLATIKAKTREVSNGRVDVVFKIVERARIQIAAINIAGVGAARARALRPLLKTKSGANSVGGAYVAAKFRRALLKVTDYYYNRGFINVVIREPKVSFLSKNKKKLTISIKIKEGKRFRVGKLAVKGKLKAPTRAYLLKLGLRRGLLFSRIKVVNAIKRLVAFHKTKGVAKPRIAPVTKIDERRGLVHLTFQIQ